MAPQLDMDRGLLPGLHTAKSRTKYFLVRDVLREQTLGKLWSKLFANIELKKQIIFAQSKYFLLRAKNICPLGANIFWSVTTRANICVGPQVCKKVYIKFARCPCALIQPKYYLVLLYHGVQMAHPNLGQIFRKYQGVPRVSAQA